MRLGVLLWVWLSQTPASTVQIDGRRLQLGTDTFTTYFVRSGDTTVTGTAINILRSDGKVLTRIYTSTDRLSTQVDTIIDRADDLRPIAHRHRSNSGASNLAYDSGFVRGWVQLANGDTVRLDVPASPVVYNPSSFDLIVRASDLQEGMRLSLPAFNERSRVVATMQGVVTGSDTVDGQPCWVFKGDNGGVPVTFWIDKGSRALRRQVIQFQMDAVHVLDTRRRTVITVTDAEKERLIVGPTSVRHPDFGFALPLPRIGLAVDTALQRQANARKMDHPQLFSWLLHDAARSFVVLIEVYKGFGGGEAGFRRFADEMKSVFPAARGWKVLEDSLFWEVGRQESRLSLVAASGWNLRSRCIPSSASRSPGLLVCVQAMSLSSDSLDYVRDGLHIAGPP